ncbi:hypothetical protein SAMN05421780_108175 [Flexibacter flexilis DSM 6793]|uniref:Uncharacterized protein n=1 Tax=Flexibacter flexilis DSM 6793 TaxID=927664 RepID=A0A1I1LEG3_9BACT|nr:hypothetical protein [Flexibacter flexilis]SFC70902.1 hypothetical protein SAMN05421780_108175 [Flexibacter flexilis DSM 6793]
MSSFVLTPTAISPRDIQRLSAALDADINQYNDACERLADKIRGAYHKFVIHIFNTVTKTAVQTKIAVDAIMVELSPALVASYIKQSPDTAKRHIDRGVQLGLLTPTNNPTSHHFNTAYKVNLKFIHKEKTAEEINAECIASVLKHQQQAEPPAKPKRGQKQVQAEEVFVDEFSEMELSVEVSTAEEKANAWRRKTSNNTTQPKKKTKQHKSLILNVLNNCIPCGTTANCGINFYFVRNTLLKTKYKGCGNVENFGALCLPSQGLAMQLKTILNDRFLPMPARVGTNVKSWGARLREAMGLNKNSPSRGGDERLL